MTEQTPEDAIGALAETAAGAAAPIVEAQVEKWVLYLTGALGSKLMPLVPVQAQGLVASAIKAVSDNHVIIGQVTADEFKTIVHHLALGAEDQARLVWLGTGAAFQERMKALGDASKATRDHVASRLASWATAKDVAMTIVKAIATAGIPLLFGI